MNTRRAHDIFRLVTPWHARILTEVKKDIRNEHLKLDKAFCRLHFPGKVLVRLTVEDLLLVYPALIAKGHDKLADFIINRWIMRHINIYNFFEFELKTINTQVDKITGFDEAVASRLVRDAVQRFGAQDSYIFSIFNAVAFSGNHLEELKLLATNEMNADGS